MFLSLFVGMALIEMLRNCSELVQYLEAGEPTNSLQSAADETDEIPLNTSTACHETQQSILTKYSFATEGIGLFTVAVVGVFANLLSIAVLAERTMKSQITALLITLAVFDTLFLFCCIPVFAISSVRGFVDYLNTCVYKDGRLSTAFRFDIRYSYLHYSTVCFLSQGQNVLYNVLVRLPILGSQSYIIHRISRIICSIIIQNIRANKITLIHLTLPKTFEPDVSLDVHYISCVFSLSRLSGI
jgi:hypothetical protein